MAWTIKSAEEYREAMKAGFIPIFEGIEPEEIGLEKIKDEEDK